MAHFRGPASHWYKGPGQVLTETDLAVDQLLKDILLGARPGHGWLSEETADDGSRRRCQSLWVVDPIDGTRAFANRLPEFAVSIGLLVDGQSVLGGLLNPATDERFIGVKGVGATLDGAPLQPSPCEDLAGARLLSARTEMKRRRWPEIFPEATFASVSSLAYKLALVAAGRFDGLVSLRRCWDWDLAAALLLLEEAGCVATDARGGPLTLNGEEVKHQGLAIAATPALHQALLERLATAA